MKKNHKKSTTEYEVSSISASAKRLEQNGNMISNYERTFTYVGQGMNCWICLLISIITSMINILSTSTLDDSRTSTVFIVFIGILIILYAIYVYGFWGIMVAIFSSLLFCISIKTTWQRLLLNIGANTAQASIIYFFFKFTRINEFSTEKKE